MNTSFFALIAPPYDAANPITTVLELNTEFETSTVFSP